MAEYRFSLSLSAERYLAYYQGAARAVIVRAHDGRRVQFPADALRPYVTQDGVHGEFVLQANAQGRLVTLKRLT